jgi:hypothetical protein
MSKTNETIDFALDTGVIMQPNSGPQKTIANHSTWPGLQEHNALSFSSIMHVHIEPMPATISDKRAWMFAVMDGQAPDLKSLVACSEPDDTPVSRR